MWPFSLTIASSVISGSNDLKASLHCQYAGDLDAASDERNAVAAHIASSIQFIEFIPLTMKPSMSRQPFMKRKHSSILHLSL